MSMNGHVDLDLRDGYGDDAVTRPPDFAWHRGDRCRVRASGQHGIVEGWKGDRLLVCWGLQQEKQGYVRSWVPEAACDWCPPPRNSSG